MRGEGPVPDPLLMFQAARGQSSTDLEAFDCDLTTVEAHLEPPDLIAAKGPEPHSEHERMALRAEAAERLAHLGSWEWDPATDVCHFSAEWQRIHGLRCSDVALVDVMKLCHPADLLAVGEAVQRMRDSLEAVHFEHRIRRADTGEVRHLSAHGYPVIGEDGRIERVYGASVDVTDRVLAERRLVDYQRRLQRMLSGAVGALTRTVQIRDPYTAGHQERVAELSVAIAQLLAWSEEQVSSLHVAAVLHDIGKLMVPAEILAKPSRLSATELEIIRGHPEAAADILDSVEFDGPVHAAILQHHERLDGSGYPGGLRGGEIGAEARLLAVADVYEAMVSHRPYRAALPAETAAEELRSGAGVRYDPAAVDACLRLVENGFAFSTTPQ